MPLTAKGKKIRSAMQKKYGHEKGEQVFYAKEKKGGLPSGVTKPYKGKKKMMKHRSGHSGHNPGGPISRAMKKTGSTY